MSHYPLSFKANSSSENGISTLWNTVSGNETLKVSIPPEFNGPGGGFSPEDFYVLAACNCFVATFKVIAQNSKLEFEKIKAVVDCQIDKNEKGSPEIKKILFSISLQGVQEEDKARRLLEKTSQVCIVINSLKPDKEFRFDINV